MHSQELDKTRAENLILQKSGEYLKFLKDVEKRLENRLCLFERVSIDGATLRAETIYDKILAKHNVKLNEKDL